MIFGVVVSVLLWPRSSSGHDTVPTFYRGAMRGVERGNI